MSAGNVIKEILRYLDLRFRIPCQTILKKRKTYRFLRKLLKAVTSALATKIPYITVSSVNLYTQFLGRPALTVSSSK